MFRKAVLLIVMILLPMAAWPYGADGHETIALLADQILAERYPAAHARVVALLGRMDDAPLSMRAASIWADCLRSYEPDRSGNIHYMPEGMESPDCAVFHQQAADEAFSLNFVKDHYRNCEYSHKLAGCHKSFHFADIPIQSDTYANAVIGKNDHDIVHALAASVAILQGKPVMAPFTRIDQRAALMLLIHLIGDLHQPLHVGAIYLKQDGKPDPAPKGAAARPEETAGGNLIIVGKDNLHHLWDETSYRKHATVLEALKQDALNKLADKTLLKAGSTIDAALMESWADETLDHAAEAYAGLRFAGDGNGDQLWLLSYVGGKKGKTAYNAKKNDLHKQEVALASARLVWVLRKVFK